MTKTLVNSFIHYYKKLIPAPSKVNFCFNSGICVLVKQSCI